MRIRRFTSMRIGMLLLVACLALGIGLALAQTHAPGGKLNPAAQTPAGLRNAQVQLSAEEPKAGPAGESPVAARTVSRMRSTTQAQRLAAAKRALERGLRRGNVPHATTSICSAPFGTPCGKVDYFGAIPNYALSKLPVLSLTSGTNLPATYAVTTPGIRKFVDGLPGLGPANKNLLGNFIPVAVPFATRPPGVPSDTAIGGSDYYEIGLATIPTNSVRTCQQPPMCAAMRISTLLPSHLPLSPVIMRLTIWDR